MGRSGRPFHHPTQGKDDIVNCETIDLTQILQDTPDADHYLFSYRPDLKELMESIVKNGLLSLPVVTPLAL